MDDEAPLAVLVLVVGGHEVPLGAIGPDQPRDLRLVHLLLRIQLALGRGGASIRLRRVRSDLGEVLELAGVTEALVAGAAPRRPDATGRPAADGPQA